MNIVHVNQHVIKHNAKHGTKLPTLTAKLDAATARLFNGHATIYCHEVAGTGRVVDSNAQDRQPLSCGARVWMEFDAEGFDVRGPWMSFTDVSLLRMEAA